MLLIQKRHSWSRSMKIWNYFVLKSIFYIFKGYLFWRYIFSFSLLVHKSRSKNQSKKKKQTNKQPSVSSFSGYPSVCCRGGVNNLWRFHYVQPECIFPTVCTCQRSVSSKLMIKDQEKEGFVAFREYTCVLTCNFPIQIWKIPERQQITGLRFSVEHLRWSRSQNLLSFHGRVWLTTDVSLRAFAKK